jgi:hypothetical protein
MKKCFCILLLSAAFAAKSQDAYEADDATAQQTIVYQAPVIYESSVEYNAPVAYYAPVYYMAPQPQPPPPVVCAPERVCASPSTVVVIGGAHGAYAYGHCANYNASCSTVFHFGGQQAAAHGYRFNMAR